MKTQVIVVGGGIAGLTTALALSHVGISSLVLEKLNFDDESGAGIQLTPNATRILFQLGLDKSLTAVSHEPNVLESRHWQTGKVLCKVPLRNIVAQYCVFPYLQIRRSDLIEVLRQTCEQRTNIELIANVEVTEIDQTEDKVNLRSSNSKFSAPMVVGADGIHSTISRLIGNYKEPNFSGWRAWRTILPDPEVSLPGFSNTNVWCGTEGHIVHYPVDANRTYNCVFVTKSSDTLSGKWKQNGSVAELREYFRGWHHAVTELIDQIDQQSLFRWGLYHHAGMERTWSRNRTVLVGDAIHATMPFLAQGAALAIEDAIALANRLKTHLKHVDRGIDSFVKYRKLRVEHIQTKSERMGIVYHAGLPWSMVRDFGTKWAVNQLAKEIYSYESV